MAAEPVSAGVSPLAAVAPARNKQGSAPDAQATGFGSELASWSDAPEAPPVDAASRKDDDARDAASSAGNTPAADPNVAAAATPAPPLDGAALLAQAGMVARDAAAGKSDAPAGTGGTSTSAIAAAGSAVEPGRATPRGLPITAAEARAAATAQAAASAATAAVDGASADATAALDAAQALAATAGAATTSTDASAQAQAEAARPGASRSVLREPTPPRVTSRVAIAPIDNAAATGAAPAAAASWQRQLQASAQARTADATQPAEPRVSVAAQSAAADAKAASTAQLQQQPMQVSPEASATAAAEAMLQGALAATTANARRTERSDERSTATGLPAPVGDTGMAASGPGAALIPTVDSAAAAAAAAAYADPLAHRLMEQMSMWLSQKTQSAQLTLDVPGGSPVSVNIQVQGNEAQIAFRSDQPEARQLLTQSLPQLKDMLGAEGLMLSGASVGGGQNHEGKAEADTQFGNARFGSAAGTGDAALSALAAPVRRVAQGRLDLYV